MTSITTTLLLFLPHLVGASATEEAADLIVSAARIVTLEEGQPEVEAVAVRDGRIVALGDRDQMEAFKGPDTETIQVPAGLVVPGFIEGHGHFLGVGEARLMLDLRQATSWSAIVTQVAEAVERAGAGRLILGRGWHQEKWLSLPEGAVEGLPTHHDLSRVSPDNPVVLVHASGHASFANAKAMAMAGIDRDTPDPEGGQIVHDPKGEPTGFFRETAEALLGPAMQSATPPDLATVVQLADEECLSKGITSFQDAGSSFDTIDRLANLAEAGQIGVRLWVMVRDSLKAQRERLASARRIGVADDHLTVRAIKHSVDGALGSHGAWLLEPYADAPQSAGLNTTSLQEIEESAQLALKHDYQLCVHAIGDRANREMLDLYQRSFEKLESHDLRWRIEHVQHLSSADIPRFQELGVIASMQAVHCTSDGPWVPERLGLERSKQGAYLWRALLDSGAVVTNGTDAPVEDVDPIANFHAAVTRRMSNGRVFFAAQRMTRMEALRATTYSNAYAAFEEELKGSLALGKLGDLVILDRDILEIPEKQIRDARVLYTIVGGKVLYRAE